MSDQAEYTLKRDITSYVYPSHMKRPEGFWGTNFFEKWIPVWTTQLEHLAGKPKIVGIEIGCLHGDCSVFCAERIANGEGSVHIVIDKIESEFLKNNIAPFKNINPLIGTSYDMLRNFDDKEFADYIYIDGSKLSIDVLSDAVLAWKLLKENGILIFNDYEWGVHTQNPKLKPKQAIDAFMTVYEGHYQLVAKGWQIFLKKLPYVPNQEELDATEQYK